ncbi:MAG: DNA recombination protein RmuC [Clostridiales bacterium]|nr:DNA recombination protein RmuC [Clostridiales bacterium]
MTVFYILISLALAASLASLIAGIVLLKKKDKGAASDSEYIKTLLFSGEMQAKALNEFRDKIEKKVEDYIAAEREHSDKINDSVRDFMDKIDYKLEKIRDENNQNLNKVRENNEKYLDKIRETVSEKLESTLEQRFSQSFNIVGQRLEEINRSFMEMQNLQTGVKDLTRILSNVKTRGTWGEVSLESLLSQILAPEQYSKSVNITGSDSERVDFVINLPGKNDGKVYLPLDSKFPTEDYLRLVDASEYGNKAAVEEAAKALANRIKDFAKSIRNKYIKPPKTTDFAIMYLPIEGLYAEVVKNSGLIEHLQNTYRIVVCGPTTLAALLNSLQIGFKSVAIEKQSAEIRKLFIQFEKDFKTFSELLQKTRQKLDDVTKTIDQADKRTELIRKRLQKIDNIGEASEPSLTGGEILGLSEGTESEGEND